jgi:hypothetical protein
MNSPMPTVQRVMSIVVDYELQQRLRAEAVRQGKSVSRFVRDILQERVMPAPRLRGRGSALLNLCGLAHGELVIADIDREIYGG